MAAVVISPEALAAFRQGLADRRAGRPIMSLLDNKEDSAELVDAYCCGYDPRDELGMVRPDFIQSQAQMVQRFLKAAGEKLEAQLPRNECEFPAPTVAAYYRQKLGRDLEDEQGLSRDPTFTVITPCGRDCKREIDDAAERIAGSIDLDAMMEHVQEEVLVFIYG